MSEMLGNQYFIARKFIEACSELEAEYQSNKSNLKILKKLIICYLQTDQLAKAVESFSYLVNESIETITSTDIIRDDCPCPEIIAKLSNDIVFNGDQTDYIKLGILWLYCDAAESLKHFEKILPQSNYYEQVQKLITRIKSHELNINKE